MQTAVSYLLICKFLFQQYGVILQKNWNLIIGISIWFFLLFKELRFLPECKTYK
jgi:hypothetical protein